MSLKYEPSSEQALVSKYGGAKGRAGLVHPTPYTLHPAPYTLNQMEPHNLITLNPKP